MLVGTLGVTTVSGIILHVVSVSGCVVLVMFIVFWMSRSMVTETVESAIGGEIPVEFSSITFY